MVSIPEIRASRPKCAACTEISRVHMHSVVHDAVCSELLRNGHMGSRFQAAWNLLQSAVRSEPEPDLALIESIPPGQVLGGHYRRGRLLSTRGEGGCQQAWEENMNGILSTPPKLSSSG